MLDNNTFYDLAIAFSFIASVIYQFFSVNKLDPLL